MGPSSSQRLRELFDRYLRRELPPGGVEELVMLLRQADAEEVLSEPMRRIWEELKGRRAEHVVDWEGMYRQISRSDGGFAVSDGGGAVSDGGVAVSDGGNVVSDGRFAAPDGRFAIPDGEMNGGSVRWWEVWRWRAVAAIFLGLAGLAAYWSLEYRRPVAAGIAAAVAPAGKEVKKDSAAAIGPMSWQTTANKRVIHLPDGSMVILNRNSSMTYREVGGREVGVRRAASREVGVREAASREVVLSGEAYFDIVRRPEQPFLVHTGKIVTRVLGTAFDIKAYSNEKSVEVTVEHGKVQVLKGGTNMGLLSDKQQIRFDVGTESCSTQQVNLRSVIAWKPEEINFDDITMEEAARRIGERFKVRFDFANPALKACRVTATFYMEDDLNQIMTVICGVNQSTFAIDGNVVKIDGKGCN